MGEAYGEDDKYSLHKVYSENMKLSAVDESCLRNTDIGDRATLNWILTNNM
jgi:hypothetical protein